MVKVLAFGIVAEKISLSEIYLENVSDLHTLKDALSLRFPELANIKYSVSINRKLVYQNAPIDSDSEVALLPPFSGG